MRIPLLLSYTEAHQNIRQGILWGAENGLNCGRACNAGAGTNFCLDPGACPAGNGASWWRVSLAATADAIDSEDNTCDTTVKPDQAVFLNGQSFRINYGVPSNITSFIVDLLASNPTLAGGVPEEIQPFEVAA